MKEYFYRYVYQHNETGRIYTKIYSLSEIEKGIQNKKGYSLIARNKCIESKDENKNDLFEGDIVKFEHYDNMEWTDNDEMIFPVNAQISEIKEKGVISGDFYEDG